ncbi:hypothetical protein C8J57DRAFT_1707072 [Mycena rebaudengoi]|nr:hypothetical protein C8J57DRAFT_1707072 [Mycena rebaudengoi]
MRGPHFEDLSEDLICCTLLLCDIYTVLSISQVNKNFQRIARSKQIWIRLIEDLAARRLIDLPDRALPEHSTAELMEEVKRIVLGPKTWSRPSQAAPIISRELRIPSLPLDNRETLQSFQLLPGGTHLIVEHINRLDLWHVATSAVIWSLDNWMETSRFRYSIELLDHQRSAVFQYFDTPHCMRLIHIDLDTGYSAELFRVDCPQEAQFAAMPTISGDFFRCGLWGIGTGANYLMVGNWRTGETVIFTYASQTWVRLRTILGAGHIFLFARHRHQPNSLWIFAFSLEDFFCRWHPKPTTSIDDAISIDDVPSTIAQEVPFTDPYGTHMALYTSPLRHDTYKLMLYLTRNMPLERSRYPFQGLRRTLFTLFKHKVAEPPSSTICSFHFSISDNHTIVSSALSSSAGTAFLYSYDNPTYAAYSGTRAGVVNLHLHDPSTGKRRSDRDKKPLLPGSIDLSPWHLSPYSHALTGLRDRNYVIVYYL